MSDIMLGVLKMTDDMFWSDDIITRHQHNQIRLEAAGVIESQKSIIAELEQQTNILQGNWDRCFNSRAEFIRDKAELEKALNSFNPVCYCQCCRDVERFKDDYSTR